MNAPPSGPGIALFTYKGDNPRGWNSGRMHLARTVTSEASAVVTDVRPEVAWRAGVRRFTNLLASLPLPRAFSFPDPYLLIRLLGSSLGPLNLKRSEVSESDLPLLEGNTRGRTLAERISSVFIYFAYHLEAISARHSRENSRPLLRKGKGIVYANIMIGINSWTVMYFSNLSPPHPQTPQK